MEVENKGIDEQLHGLVLPTATSEATGQFGTSGGVETKKYGPREINLREKFLNWFIGWLLPGFHLAKNPPKGYKRHRKEKGGLV